LPVGPRGDGDPHVDLSGQLKPDELLVERKLAVHRVGGCGGRRGVGIWKAVVTIAGGACPRTPGGNRVQAAEEVAGRGGQRRHARVRRGRRAHYPRRSVRVIVESAIRACGCSLRAVKLPPERSTEGCCVVRDPGRCSAAECRAARPWGGAGAGAPDRPVVDVALAHERTVRETRIAAALHHPHIVSIFEGRPGIRDGIRSSAMASSRVRPTPPSMILGTSTRLSRAGVRIRHGGRVQRNPLALVDALIALDPAPGCGPRNETGENRTIE
jgi:hypothetical protein